MTKLKFIAKSLKAQFQYPANHKTFQYLGIISVKKKKIIKIKNQEAKKPISSTLPKPKKPTIVDKLPLSPIKLNRHLLSLIGTD